MYERVYIISMLKKQEKHYLVEVFKELVSRVNFRVIKETRLPTTDPVLNLAQGSVVLGQCVKAITNSYTTTLFNCLGTSPCLHTLGLLGALNSPKGLEKPM